MMLVNGSAVEFETETSSQNGTFWIAAKYWPSAQVGTGGAAAAGELVTATSAVPATPIRNIPAMKARSTRRRIPRAPARVDEAPTPI